MFSIYDQKAEAYLQPFFFTTIGQAIRVVTDTVHDENHQFCRHAADYTLFEIGEFDDSTATFTYEKNSLGCLLEFKKTFDSVLGDTKKLKAIGGTD